MTEPTFNHPDQFDEVRVIDHHVDVERTVRRLTVDADLNRYTILDKPAVNHHGVALPSKRRNVAWQPASPAPTPPASSPEPTTTGDTELPDGAADQAAEPTNA